MAIAQGAKYESGTVTIGNAQTSCNLTFNSSFSKYLAFIEMVDESKTTLVNSGVNGNRSYAMMFVYPALSINGSSENNNGWVFRINPSTSAKNTTYTSYSGDTTKIQRSCSSIASGGTTDLYQGCTYKWFAVEIMD